MARLADSSSTLRAIEATTLEAKLILAIERAEKAEAEAAALREALTFYADYASWSASKVDYAGVGTPGPAYSDTGRKARKAISHPGVNESLPALGY
jgi:hypothetical protein